MLRTAVNLAGRDCRSLAVKLAPGAGHASSLAADLLSRVIRDLGYETDVLPIVSSGASRIYCVLASRDQESAVILRNTGIDVNTDGVLAAFDGLSDIRRKQAFVAAIVPGDPGGSLVLAAETDTGLRNALITLSDRLYLEADGSLVADSFEGVHAPAFDARHIKTDAMNCGPLRWSLDYWDPTTNSGVDEFARWLASFRITDYDFLAFVRGWGTSYSSERFPGLVDPQHPNTKYEFYPHLIDRLHDWGIKVWASDIYIHSGYTMETGTNPAMLSPCVDASKLEPFRAGERSFWEILGDPNAIACLSHPSAAGYYAALVDDLMEHYPTLDGLDFHIGHTFTGKICRCSACVGFDGNREGVYRSFARVYETAVTRRPNIRLKTSAKMFGDATRKIVERYEKFPNLEFFCWLRWIGNLRLEEVDAPVNIGHEDGGGGLEMNYHNPNMTLADTRGVCRDYEPYITTYVRVARRAAVSSISWEPQLHRELEQLYFIYSQLTWEPELSLAELARRVAIRMNRRLDDALVEAYRLLLEIDESLTHWCLCAYGPGLGQFPEQMGSILETTSAREKMSALERLVKLMALDSIVEPDSQPAHFDLRWHVLRSWQRLNAGKSLWGGL